MEPYFHLKGTYKTSAEASAARADIEKFIDEAGSTILQKGVPAGRGAKIIGWDVNENGVFFDIGDNRFGNFCQLDLRVTHCRRGVAVDGAEISLPFYQGIAHRKILGQSDQGVIYGHVTVGMIFSEDFPDDFRAFGKWRTGPQAH